jgi:predicted TPR repeat methyltransferase
MDDKFLREQYANDKREFERFCLGCGTGLLGGVFLWLVALIACQWLVETFF